jgi:peptide deformylase
MIYPITIYGNPVLRKETVDIDKDYPELQQLIEDMFKTLYRAEGVGLAAPQIGLSIRLFVIDLNVLAEDDPACDGFKKVFINPKIVEYSEKTETRDEGCLSLPGINESVKRSWSVNIAYFDENWVRHEEVIEGFPARAVQHEYDHLEGKMFIDHLSPIRRQMNRTKLSSMVKGKIRCRYTIKSN